MIESQNDDLNIDNWQVLNRTEVKNYHALTFEVDQASYERLHKQDFSVENGFGQIVKLDQRKKNSGKKSDQKGPTHQEGQPMPSPAER
jgi:Domain of unknown function (DUF4780)